MENLNEARSILGLIKGSKCLVSDYWYYSHLLDSKVTGYVNKRVDLDSNYWKEYDPEKDTIIVEDFNLESEKIWIYILKGELGENNDAANNKNLRKILSLKELFT